MQAKRRWNHENAALLLSYVVPELKLSNTQIGLMNSAQSPPADLVGG